MTLPDNAALELNRTYPNVRSNRGGAYIWSKRTAMGLSQEELRKAINDKFGEKMAAGLVSKYETGKTYPSESFLCKARIVLKLSAAEYDALVNLVASDMLLNFKMRIKEMEDVYRDHLSK